MIQLKITGRAGNQFFQYATVYSYMKKNNIKETMYISFQELARKKTDNYTFFDTLAEFNTTYKKVMKIKMTKYQKILDFFYKVNIKILRIYRKILKSSMQKKDYIFIEKLWHKKLNKNGLYYYMPTNFNFYKSKNKNIIFYGSFESPKFFEQYKEDLLKIFTPKHKDKIINKKLYQKIEDTNSVCITIRRGDFLIDKYKKDFYICTPKYFEKAIDKVKKLISSPQFIVFSDDINWCKKNMKFPSSTLYESGKDEIWEKMRLMYSCKNFIISNSTFSWWAQYLSRNKEKVVIAPEKWNNFEYSKNIYEKEWSLIKGEEYNEKN